MVGQKYNLINVWRLGNEIYNIIGYPYGCKEVKYRIHQHHQKSI